MTLETSTDPVGRALWFIESHSSHDLTLDAIAAASGVSRFHLCRAFTTVTGMPVMRYVRGRRLSDAARRLCDGASDILAIALEAGYGSHEAFTRAFHERFGVTPESMRAAGSLDGVDLLNALRKDNTMVTDIQTPRFVDAPALLIAGLTERHRCDSVQSIPAQWQRFAPYIGHVPGQTGSAAYGVRSNFDDDGNFVYTCGVEVTGFDDIPNDLTQERIPAQRYAVFTHRGHIAAIRATWQAVFSAWLPSAGLEVVDAPDFERYGDDFDAHSGMGNVELWVPVRS